MGKKDEGFVNDAGVLPAVIAHRMLKRSTPEPVVCVSTEMNHATVQKRRDCNTPALRGLPHP